MKTPMILGLVVATALAGVACPRQMAGQVQAYPPSFHTQEIQTNGTTLHVRVGGKGPAVVLLHGYGETGDMWTPSPSSSWPTTR